MKKGVAGMLFFFSILFCFSGTALCAVPETGTGGAWVLEGDEWRYKLSDHEYLAEEWISSGEKWYYLDEDGYMSVGTKRIDGKYYYFRENGEMATGWAYDEDEAQWYYMDGNGTRTTGWHEASGVWYWFDSKGMLFQDGFRMIDGHKYYFFENGQMAANKYVDTKYYGADGLRSRQYDMTIQGKRKPTEEEEAAITKAMESIPGGWMAQCLSSGWEFMFYTDKDFFAAPATELGVYYIYHKTDTNYKKIKFTKPESLVMAVGEYIAFTTGNDKEASAFMADFEQYILESNLVEPLPSYFDDKPETWFGRLLESYGDSSVFYDIKKRNPGLAKFMTDTLKTDISGFRPSLEELRDIINKESQGDADTEGPSTAQELEKKEGPASVTGQ